MVHQPYSSWLLGEAQLTPEQQMQLQKHFLHCKECQPIQQAWSSVKKEIKSSPLVTPAPGFSSRFKAYLQIRNTVNQNHLAKRWLLGLSIATVVTLVLLVAQMFSSGSGFALISGFSQISQLVNGIIHQARNISWLFFHNAPPWIWVILGVGVGSWIAISIATGSFIIARARRKEVINHED
jgi:hypothetical protein